MQNFHNRADNDFKKQDARGAGFEHNPYISRQDHMMEYNPYLNRPEDGLNANAMKKDSLFGDSQMQNFVLGALVGAAGAYLLTNEKAQKNMFKAFAKGGEMLNAGVEEMKERFEDAKAEMEAQK